MSQYLNNETIKLVIATTAFILLLLGVFFVYRYFLNIVRRRALKSNRKFDAFAVNILKIPVLWVFYWILFKVFTHVFYSELELFPYLQHFNNILLIFTLAWVSVQLVTTGAYYLQNKLDIDSPDNLHARKSLTQIKIFRAIVVSIIIIIAISASLLTFDGARKIGISLLTSAGVFGIIVGFAAQKSIAMILAGIQIAITQPIRLDDVVIVEGEWGRIEEITLTYVVVKIWDERRLVLPATWFLEKPFQNWTRNSADIMGTIFLYVDYNFPVDALREALPAMVKDNPNWDKRVINVQVTNTSERNKEVRVLLSSPDAGKNWDLRTAAREKIIDFINANYPDSFAKVRLISEK